MRRWIKLLFALLGATAIAIIVFLALNHEPRYQGRRLSQWLTVANSPQSTTAQHLEADHAIRQIGTNALPTLISSISQSGSRPKQRILRTLFRLPRRIVPGALIRWAAQGPDTTRMENAQHAFLVLGSQGAPAIPKLTRIATELSPPEGASAAVAALGFVGHQAIPALVRIVNNRQASVRAAAILEIARFGADAQVALPTLVACMNDPDPEVVYNAALALGSLSARPETVIPALVKGLGHADEMAREGAVYGLGAFGAAALNAVPELKKAAEKETDEDLKELILQTANGITSAAAVPETAQ